MKRQTHNIVILSALSWGLLTTSTVLADAQQTALNRSSSATKLSHTYPIKKVRSSNNQPSTLLKRHISSSSKARPQTSGSRLIHSALPYRLTSSS